LNFKRCVGTIVRLVLSSFVPARIYDKLDSEYARHGRVRHTIGEYGYTDRKTGVTVHTNTLEGYNSIFKRGMKGIYQHCKEKHLHRYVAEFEFRYSNRSALGVEGKERVTMALTGIKGKRLMYETVGR